MEGMVPAHHAGSVGAGVFDGDEGRGGRKRRPKRGVLNLEVELIPLTMPEVRRLLVALIWFEPRPPERVIGWSIWRRRHQARARRSHYKRRLARQCPQVR